MQWWTDFLDWLNSDTGWRIISTVVIPFVAIVVAGIVAAAIGRASARKVIELSEREVRASAVTALISAARKAAVWNTLPAPEQQHIDHLIGDAEIRLRLLPIAGTGLAADWARHEIAGMKRNAISFSFQAEQSLLVFRDRLIEWQGRPSRAKKLFKNDIDSWAYDSSASEQELVHQQQKWAAQQVTETGPIPTVTTTPLTRPRALAPIDAPLIETTSAVAAAGLASAAAPAAETVALEMGAPGATAAARVEPSSPEATVPAGDGPHPLVEPADTSSHDVSEASIFGANPPPKVVEPEKVEPEHAEPVHAERDTEPQSSESEIIEGEIVQSDTHQEPPSEGSAPENHGHDDHHGHDNHDNHDNHNNHNEHRHDEWRG